MYLVLRTTRGEEEYQGKFTNISIDSIDVAEKEVYFNCAYEDGEEVLIRSKVGMACIVNDNYLEV